MATEAPGCSVTLRSNVTEANVDGLCPGTQYEITIISVAGEALSESTSLTVETLGEYIPSKGNLHLKLHI